MKDFDINTVVGSDLVEQTFRFWFTDSEHIRSPFPTYIQDQLQTKATEKFFTWTKGLDPKAKDELVDEAISEKFEEIIFEEACNLVRSDDEILTILYPFLPRLGDTVEQHAASASLVTHREMEKEGDHKFLKLTLEKIGSSEKWETKIELPT